MSASPPEPPRHSYRDCLADRWGVCVNGGFDPVSKSVWFALNGKG